jgi:hypothetical protein
VNCAADLGDAFFSFPKNPKTCHGESFCPREKNALATKLKRSHDTNHNVK